MVNAFAGLGVISSTLILRQRGRLAPSCHNLASVDVLDSLRAPVEGLLLRVGLLSILYVGEILIESGDEMLCKYRGKSTSRGGTSASRAEELSKSSPGPACRCVFVSEFQMQ